MADFKINVRHLKPSEGSHIPVLMKVLGISEGPVLELGTGLNSTPVIHWICNEQNQRKIVSYESSEMFYLAARKYRCDYHEVHNVETLGGWDKIDIESQHWGMVFVDHAPGPRRVEEMIRVANNADYVVVHDTEGRSDWHYHYSKGFPLYKYRWDYTTAYPYTSVLSNIKDLHELKGRN